MLSGVSLWPVVKGRDGDKPLKVWFWTGRDRSSLEDLHLLFASRSRGEINAALTRLRLPKPEGEYVVVNQTDARWAVATTEPERIFWRCTDLGPDWHGEEELDALRARATAVSPNGTPLHRP